jgi:1,2-dihydroxy-3-keto-5-methylthiopentene dioxygenase
MASVRIPDEQRTLTDQDEVTRYLARLGIEYERWPNAQRVPEKATAEEVLAAYEPEIERLKASGGYVTADVIDVTAQTPNLEAMLDKFRTGTMKTRCDSSFAGGGCFTSTPGTAVPSLRSR